MKVLVCGGRDFADAEMLDKALRKYNPTLIIHGGAKGADRLAGQWAIDHHIPVTCYPAEWEVYGPGAGPKRNQLMLDEEKPDVVVAMPGGKGTADMVRRAHAAEVTVYHADTGIESRHEQRAR